MRQNGVAGPREFAGIIELPTVESAYFHTTASKVGGIARLTSAFERIDWATILKPLGSS